MIPRFNAKRRSGMNKFQAKVLISGELEIMLQAIRNITIWRGNLDADSQEHFVIHSKDFVKLYDKLFELNNKFKNTSHGKKVS